MYFRLEPDSDSHVEILLFREVQNAKEIRAKLFKGQLAAALLQAPLVRPECCLRNISKLTTELTSNFACWLGSGRFPAFGSNSFSFGKT